MQRHLDIIDELDEEKRSLEARMAVNSLPTESGRPNKSAGPFKSWGEQLTAVRNAAAPGGQSDPRLFEVRAASGLSEGVNSDGGFLVQSDFSSTVLQNVWTQNKILSRIRRIPISGNANGLIINGIDETSRADGYRGGGVTSYWKGEADAFVGSKPKFRRIELKLNKLVGLCYATDELLQDSTALEAAVVAAFKDEISFKIADCIFNGTGAGQPLGVMNAGCLVTVDKQIGQGNATFVYENASDMWARLLPSSHKNACWFINQNLIPQLHTMSLAVGTGGGPVYLPAAGASATPYTKMFGAPVVPVEQCATLGTTGDIILADLSQYIGVDKGGVKMDTSIHVRFLWDEQVFRFVYRFDGQPILASAITPKNGTDTMSPFVALQSRTA